jgi:hypothetical protein
MKETYYFQHDFEPLSDPKLASVISEYGALGYGLFWRIIEVLHSDENHKLKHKQYVYLALAQQMKTNVEQIESFVNYCILVSELFVSDGEYFWSERVMRNIAKRNDIIEKRKMAGKKSAEMRIERQELTANVEQVPTSVEQNPTKEIKENEIKRKRKNKEFTPPTLYAVENYFIENGYDKTLAKTFFDGYSVNDWKDSHDKKITNWKQKAIQVWFKDKDKKTKTDRISVLDMTPEEQAKAQQESYDKFFE